MPKGTPRTQPARNPVKPSALTIACRDKGSLHGCVMGLWRAVRMGMIAATSLAAFSPQPAQADNHFGPLAGKPRAVDGDTLEFGRNTRCRFAAFCGAGFDWNDIAADGK